MKFGTDDDRYQEQIKQQQAEQRRRIQLGVMPKDRLRRVLAVMRKQMELEPVPMTRVFQMDRQDLINEIVRTETEMT